jgi:formylglycine-generating enzyme required for sulfatase activity
MGQTPATVGVWKKYRNATGAAELGGRDILGRILNENAGNDALPAVGMTWDEATSYCEWSGGRLPTESEWEYAARAGTTGARYGALDGIAWYGDNSGRERIDSAALHAHAYAVQGTAQIAQTRDVGPVSIVTTATFPKVLGGYYQKLFENGNAPRPVGLKLPNAWNLYDVLGDVWQWTEIGARLTPIPRSHLTRRVRRRRAIDRCAADPVSARQGTFVYPVGT